MNECLGRGSNDLQEAMGIRIVIKKAWSCIAFVTHTHVCKCSWSFGSNKAVMTLTLDYREKALSEVMGVQHDIQNLPVGDVRCIYDDGFQWILERKSARDFANSIRTGRWSDY